MVFRGSNPLIRGLDPLKNSHTGAPRQRRDAAKYRIATNYRAQRKPKWLYVPAGESYKYRAKTPA